MWGTIAFIILRRTINRPIIPRPPRAERRAARRAERAGRARSR
jgi:hypothetical protein